MSVSLDELQKNLPGRPRDSGELGRSLASLQAVVFVPGIEISALKATRDEFSHPEQEGDVVSLVPQTLYEGIQQPLEPPLQLLEGGVVCAGVAPLLHDGSLRPEGKHVKRPWKGKLGHDHGLDELLKLLLAPLALGLALDEVSVAGVPEVLCALQSSGPSSSASLANVGSAAVHVTLSTEPLAVGGHDNHGKELKARRDLGESALSSQHQTEVLYDGRSDLRIRVHEDLAQRVPSGKVKEGVSPALDGLAHLDQANAGGLPDGSPGLDILAKGLVPVARGEAIVLEDTNEGAEDAPDMGRGGHVTLVHGNVSGTFGNVLGKAANVSHEKLNGSHDPVGGELPLHGLGGLCRFFGYVVVLGFIGAHVQDASTPLSHQDTLVRKSDGLDTPTLGASSPSSLEGKRGTGSEGRERSQNGNRSLVVNSEPLRGGQGLHERLEGGDLVILLSLGDHSGHDVHGVPSLLGASVLDAHPEEVFLQHVVILLHGGLLLLAKLGNIYGRGSRGDGGKNLSQHANNVILLGLLFALSVQSPALGEEFGQGFEALAGVALSNRGKGSDAELDNLEEEGRSDPLVLSGTLLGEHRAVVDDIEVERRAHADPPDEGLHPCGGGTADGVDALWELIHGSGAGSNGVVGVSDGCHELENCFVLVVMDAVEDLVTLGVVEGDILIDESVELLLGFNVGGEELCGPGLEGTRVLPGVEVGGEGSLSLCTLRQELGEPKHSVAVLLKVRNDHGNSSGTGSGGEGLRKKDVVHDLNDAAPHVAVDDITVTEGLENDLGDPGKAPSEAGVVVIVVQVHADLDDLINGAVLVVVDGGELGLGVVSLVDLGKTGSSVLTLSL
mmetsp:Transcript_16230/g.33346  ORF Transcript_16230/g.33346 Transcript_16230/m.33346 type:complete len:840 (-) Transcript_16230:1240-3759(-)